MCSTVQMWSSFLLSLALAHTLVMAPTWSPLVPAPEASVSWQASHSALIGPHPRLDDLRIGFQASSAPNLRLCVGMTVFRRGLAFAGRTLFSLAEDELAKTADWARFRTKMPYKESLLRITLSSARGKSFNLPWKATIAWVPPLGTRFAAPLPSASNGSSLGCQSAWEVWKSTPRGADNPPICWPPAGADAGLRILRIPQDLPSPWRDVGTGRLGAEGVRPAFAYGALQRHMALKQEHGGSGCDTMLIVEDDVAAAQGWQAQVHGAVAEVRQQDPKWRLLKLFFPENLSGWALADEPSHLAAFAAVLVCAAALPMACRWAAALVARFARFVGILLPAARAKAHDGDAQKAEASVGTAGPAGRLQQLLRRVRCCTGSAVLPLRLGDRSRASSALSLASAGRRGFFYRWAEVAASTALAAALLFVAGRQALPCPLYTEACRGVRRWSNTCCTQGHVFPRRALPFMSACMMATPEARDSADGDRLQVDLAMARCFRQPDSVFEAHAGDLSDAALLAVAADNARWDKRVDPSEDADAAAATADLHGHNWLMVPYPLTHVEAGWTRPPSFLDMAAVRAAVAEARGVHASNSDNTVSVFDDEALLERMWAIYRAASGGDTGSSAADGAAHRVFRPPADYVPRLSWLFADDLEGRDFA